MGCGASTSGHEPSGGRMIIDAHPIRAATFAGDSFLQKHKDARCDARLMSSASREAALVLLYASAGGERVRSPISRFQPTSTEVSPSSSGAATPELLRRLEPVSHLQGVGSKPSTPELMRRLQPVGKSPTSPLRRMRLSWERGGAQESGEA